MIVSTTSRIDDGIPMLGGVTPLTFGVRTLTTSDKSSSDGSSPREVALANWRLKPINSELLGKVLFLLAMDLNNGATICKE